MRGVSAEALATATERLETQAESGDAERLGRDLFAVHELLGTEPSLRRALTDPAAAPEAKAALAETLLSGKVGDETVDVVKAAAGLRWSSTTDFVAATERMGVLAYVVAAEKQSQLADLEDDLFRFGRLVVGNPPLRDAITNKQVPVDKRQGLVAGLLEGKASAPAAALAVQAVASWHQSFEAALEDFQKVAATRQSRSVAVVRSAVALTDTEHDRLAAALAAQYGRDVHLNVVIDPDVLGGIKVEIGDEVIDGTVAGRLDDARRRMVG